MATLPKEERGIEPQKPRASKAASGPASAEAARPVSKLSEARLAVHDFLVNELGARSVRITKIVPHDQTDKGWSAEAEILVPNLEVKMLGLPLTQEVLELERYTMELDLDLAVVSYEHSEPESD